MISSKLTSCVAFDEYIKTVPDGRQVSLNGCLGYDEAEWEAWRAALDYVSPLLKRMIAYHDTQCRSEPMFDIAHDMREFLKGMKVWATT